MRQRPCRAELKAPAMANIARRCSSGEKLADMLMPMRIRHRRIFDGKYRAVGERHGVASERCSRSGRSDLRVMRILCFCRVNTSTLAECRNSVLWGRSGVYNAKAFGGTPMFIHVPVQGCCLGGRVGSMLWVGELATPWRRGLCLRPPRCVSTGPVVCVLPGWQMNVNVNVNGGGVAKTPLPSKRVGHDDSP